MGPRGISGGKWVSRGAPRPPNTGCRFPPGPLSSSNRGCDRLPPLPPLVSQLLSQPWPTARVLLNNAASPWGRPVHRGAWTAKTVKRPRQQPAQPPIRQLLGAADAQTAHPATSRHSPGTPTTGLRERGNDTSGSTGRSGRQNAATRRNMRRDERVTVQGPVKGQQPDGMSHGGGGVSDPPPPPLK